MLSHESTIKIKDRGGLTGSKGHKWNIICLCKPNEDHTWGFFIAVPELSS